MYGHWAAPFEANASHRVTVSVSDSRNADGSADTANDATVAVIVSDGAQSADVPVAVTVTDDNEPFTLEGDTAFDHDENSTHRVTVFRVVDDPETGPIDWEMSGTDRGAFTVDNGVLSFAEVPNHESPADSSRDRRFC